MKFFHVLFVVLCFYTILNENTFGSLTTTWPNDDVIVSDQKPFIKAIDKAKNYIILGTYKIQDHMIYDSEILKKINEKIRKLKGCDFQIGHAYFMDKNMSLTERMNKKVIPLLLEYFMNDETEVNGILTNAGLVVEPDSWPMKIHI